MPPTHATIPARPGRQALRKALLIAFFLALPITLNYYSPYLMTQAAVEHVVNFSLLFWAAVFLTAPVLGRAFCGWICPFHGLQLAWESVRDRPTRQVGHARWVKYALWAAWAGGVTAIVATSGAWTRVDPLYMTAKGVSLTEPGNYVTYYLLVGLTLGATAWGKRGFCHYLCPFGVWGIVGEKLGHALRVPRLRLRADSSACKNCGACEKACPMSLPVRSMVAEERTRDTECVLCGSCVDGCASGGVRFGFGRAQ